MNLNELLSCCGIDKKKLCKKSFTGVHFGKKYDLTYNPDGSYIDRIYDNIIDLKNKILVKINEFTKHHPQVLYYDLIDLGLRKIIRNRKENYYSQISKFNNKNHDENLGNLYYITNKIDLFFNSNSR